MLFNNTSVELDIEDIERISATIACIHNDTMLTVFGYKPVSNIENILDDLYEWMHDTGFSISDCEYVREQIIICTDYVMDEKA